MFADCTDNDGGRWRCIPLLNGHIDWLGEKENDSGQAISQAGSGVTVPAMDWSGFARLY
jgi:hypothetical protein